jgi:hypothetical protein
MNSKSKNQIAKFLFWILPAGMILSLCFGMNTSPAARAQEVATPTQNDYYNVNMVTLSDGKVIEVDVINGPPQPPVGYERPTVPMPDSPTILGFVTLSVPAFDYSFGCSATSGSMIASYYDRNGYPNIYTGPTNGGVMPMDSSSWPNWTDGNNHVYGQCPLTASRNGLDGRASRGSIDDYWIQKDSIEADPYITNGWTQHTWGDAIGDYMKTSQSSFGNIDGLTQFTLWQDSPDPLTCDYMASNSLPDGTLGRRQFYEARGYTVTDCYNQFTDNQYAGGFSFAQYKAEIDAGRPVMLNLTGHTVVGVGYDDSSTSIFIHDTWDYYTHTMIWGGDYAGMTLRSVSIVNLLPASVSPMLSAGFFHTCWLKSDGTLACWGAGTTNTGVPHEYGQSIPPVGRYTQVSAGSQHTCGLKSDGTLTCWGGITYENTPPAGTFTQVSAGRQHTCGIKNDGTLACWGFVSDATTPPAGTYTQISAGDWHNCGLKSDGTLTCWGDNDYGQSTPPAGTFTQVSAGGWHTCGLKSDGTIACWGNNEAGQSTPPAGTFTHVSAGHFHTCGLKSDGTLACWGNNNYGQSTAPSGTFTQISAGGWHTCGLKSDGTLTCWGWNDYGQANPFSISGNAEVGGATLSYTDGTDKTVTTDDGRNYSLAVSYNWSGIVTPSLSGYTFSPENRTYANVQLNQKGENYTASLNANLLSVSKTGTGNGIVTSEPTGIDCGSACSYSFNYNISVTLTAVPATGSTFTGWSGEGCSGTGTCTVTMNSAQSINATFNTPFVPHTIRTWQDGDGRWWVENDYYRIELTDASSFIVKMGSGEKEWRVSTFPNWVGGLANNTQGSGYYYTFWHWGDNRVDSFEVVETDAAHALIKIVSHGDNSINSISVENLLTFDSDSPAIQVGTRLLSSGDLYPIMTLAYNFFMAAGGDEQSDWFTWSGGSPSLFPYYDWRDFHASDFIPADNDYIHLSVYDTAASQGIALIAKMSDTSDLLTDSNYGRALVEGRTYGWQPYFSIHMDASRTTHFYIYPFTVGETNPVTPVENFIHQLANPCTVPGFGTNSAFVSTFPNGTADLDALGIIPTTLNGGQISSLQPGLGFISSQGGAAYIRFPADWGGERFAARLVTNAIYQIAVLEDDTSNLWADSYNKRFALGLNVDHYGPVDQNAGIFYNNGITAWNAILPQFTPPVGQEISVLFDFKSHLFTVRDTDGNIIYQASLPAIWGNQNNVHKWWIIGDPWTDNLYSVNFQLKEVCFKPWSIPLNYTISGNAGVGGATLTYTDGTVKTFTAESNGIYSIRVSSNWSGRVTPSKDGYTFDPASIEYTDVLSDQLNQDYSATAITFTISGDAGVAGAILNFDDSGPQTATAAEDGSYSFTVSYNWSGTVTPSLLGYTFSPTNRTYIDIQLNQTGENYTASLNTYLLSVNKPGTGNGIVSSEPTGIDCGSACSYSFNYNTSVTLTAATATGSTFTGWSGYTCPGTGTCTIYMDAAKSVTANFTLNTYSLNVSKGGTGSGTVTSNPAGIDCGSDCSETYNYNTSVTLTAASATGSTFTGWSGYTCPGTGTCIVLMDAARSVTANFTLNTYALTITKTGTGSGTVTSNPEGIDCGSDCSETYDYNTSVTLTAAADTGSTFTDWSGYTCPGTSTCTVLIDAAKSVTSNFVLTPGAFYKSNPPDGETNQPTNPTLIWGASNNAAFYEYCLSTTSCTDTSTWISTGSATSVTLSGLRLGHTYYWQVRAVNLSAITFADGGSLWSFTTAPLMASFQSNGAYDGWVLESASHSGVGGSLNSISPILLIGDDALNRQYRSILSFDTSSLPDTAVITQVILKVMQQSFMNLIFPSNVGGNPFSLGGLTVDIRKRSFGPLVALEIGDFQAPPNIAGAGTFGSTPVSDWYSASLGSSAYPYVNLSGTTQFRLRFTTASNNNGAVDNLQLYSGNAPAANRPVLIIKYYVP